MGEETGDPPAEGVLEEMDIRSGRARLGVSRRRGGPPALLLLHAGICDRRSFGRLLDLLGSGAGGPALHVAAYDRRGSGTTVSRPERHDQVSDLRAVLDGLGMDRAVLVGNSRGGQIALDTALTLPERVSGLVLVAPAVSGAPPTEDSDVDATTAALWGHLEAAEAAGDLDALNMGEIRLWLDGPAAPEGRVGGGLRELALDMNDRVLRAPDPGFEPEPIDAWYRLDEVTCPTLVVVGDLDLPHMQARCRYLADHIPGAHMVVMPGRAHLPAFEDPEGFAAIVRHFLASSGLPGDAAP